MRSVGSIHRPFADPTLGRGRQGVATANFINPPESQRSPNTHSSLDAVKAARLLDDAGWKPGADGVRAKGGRPLAVQFEAATNAITPNVQQIIKQSAQPAGIEIELKVVTPNACFPSNAGNPDTFGRFQADVQMYNWRRAIPDPETLMQPVVS